MIKDLSETEQLKLFHRLDTILGSSYDLPRVIRKIFIEISKVIDTKNFYIAIYHPETNTISFEIYTINGKEIFVPPRTLSKGMTEYVIRTKKPLRINQNLLEQCRRLGIKPFGKMALSWLGVPMVYKNNVEGVITIQDYKRENVYTSEDENFLLTLATRAAVVVANTKLIDAQIKRARELKLMNQIAHRLTKSLNIDVICENVTKSILENFRKFNVACFLLEGNQIVLKKLSSGFKAEVPKDLKLKTGQGIVGHAVEIGETFVANNVSKCQYFLAFGQTTTKSEIAIPLKISGKTIGVLDIQCNELNAFNPETVRVLELIADRLSVAIHNALLYQDAINHAKELSVSFRIAKSLVSTLNLDTVLNQILKVIRDTFGYANCAILLIDKKRDELYIKAANGYPIKFWKEARLSIKRREGITGYVAATGKSFYAPDVSKVPFYACWKKSIRSEATVPLKIKGEVIGVLDIESEKLNAFTEDDLKTFEIFASQAAIAIENARLFDETKSLSLTDSLTRIPNRRHFDLVIDRELKKARSYSRPITVAMIDLDNFKQFNDRYGHPIGDKMLIHIAQMIKNNIRDTDFVARYGGEEFVLVLPETDNFASLKVIERLRALIEQTPLKLSKIGPVRITISAGLATCPSRGLTADKLIQNADTAMYRAKNLGKNRVISA
ncbi:MAG: diguanylate cyclase [candidate division WOR-3 bacterium]